MPKYWVPASQPPAPHQAYWQQLVQVVKQSTTRRPAQTLPVVTNRSGMEPPKS